MDSLKETDNLATKPSKRPRIEVDEELMRQMIAGQAPLGFESHPPDSRTGSGKYGRSRGKDIGNGIRSIGSDC